MLIEITYQQTENYTSYQPCHYGTNQPILFTFLRQEQREDIHVIESTAQALPLTEEATQ